MSTRPSATRRTVLRGAALTPVAGLGLTACSPGESEPTLPSEPISLGAESEVPKGGAKLYEDEKVVVSRAADGSLKAYSTICTHGGCPINKLSGTTLVCPCHGSRFEATTGKVLKSPASVPLTELSVEVKNGKIMAGPEA